jgi:hypothetical protein
VLTCMKISVTGHPPARIHSYEAYTRWHLRSSTNRIPTTTELRLRGAGASGFVGNLCLPPGFNNLSHAETRVAIAFGGFAAQNLLREFTPDLLKATQRWNAPFPRIPLPQWWVKLPAH